MNSFIANDVRCLIYYKFSDELRNTFDINGNSISISNWFTIIHSIDYFDKYETYRINK